MGRRRTAQTGDARRALRDSETEIFPYEIKRGGNYTADPLKHIKESYPGGISGWWWARTCSFRLTDGAS
jgi:hypothetical protein